jgi:hypothetical protein
MTENQSGENWREKRAYPRINFYGQVRVEVLRGILDSETPQQIIAPTKNLSMGGLLISTAEYYPTETFCRVHMRKNLFSPEFHLQGEVIRSKINPASSDYDTAISFAPPTYEQMAQLLQVVESASTY